MEGFAGGADAGFVAADGLIKCFVGGFKAAPDFFQVLGEGDDAGKKELRGFGDFLGVLGLGVLLPAHGDGAEQGDQGRGGGEQDALFGGPDDEVAVAFQGGAEEGFGGDEEHDVVQGVGELAGVITVGEGLDGGF